MAVMRSASSTPKYLKGSSIRAKLSTTRLLDLQMMALLLWRPATTKRSEIKNFSNSMVSKPFLAMAAAHLLTSIAHEVWRIFHYIPILICHGHSVYIKGRLWSIDTIWAGFVPENDNPGEWVKGVAECYYDGADPIGKSHVREGVVCRIVNRPKFTAYKHKNFAFKVLEGIIKDTAAAPDMEEQQEADG